MKRVLITAALPYANGAIHFGHLAGSYLPADCYARFERLCGEEVAFICGSDEYGVAIAMSAELAGRSPQEHVDHFHAINKALFKAVNISFDHYSRTSWSGHASTTLAWFDALRKKGWVEQQATERLFCEEDGKFYADRYVMGICPRCGYEQARGDECTSCGASYEAEDLKNPVTKIGKKPLILKRTTHWCLLLDRLKDKLLQWIDTKAWKLNVINFAKKYIQDIRPRAITRDMQWGVPVPNEPGKVFYVWFDAPIGYISATKEWGELHNDPKRWEKFWLEEECRLVQFVGKDNIPFHAVVFPAMVMGQDLPYKLVDDLPANEFYTLAGKQFSKSDGWFIDVQDFLQRYTADQLRYTIASNAPETQDAEFTWNDFMLRCNSDLCGKFGNFIHRTVVFAVNKCQGMVPEAVLSEQDISFIQECKNIVAKTHDAFATYRLRKACSHIMELAQLGNGYFNIKEPWVDAKTNIERMHTTIACSLECVKLLALVCKPVLPATSEAIVEQLQFAGGYTWDSWVEQPLIAGHRLGAPKILFPKIEESQIAQEEAKLQSRA